MLVNSASYRVNLDAMRACLEAGCHYIDLGGLYHLTGEQLDLGPQFETAGLLALLGMGSSPGKTNVMAVRAVEELGATPRASRRVSPPGAICEPPDGPSYPYAPRTLVDELTEPPMAIRGGEPVALEPMQDGGTYPLPRADRRGRDDLHAALRGAHVRRQLRLHGVQLPPEPGARSARAGARAWWEPRTPRSTRRRARGGAVLSEDGVRARGRGRGDAGVVTVTALTRGMEEWGLGGGVVSTAAPAAAAVRLLARGEIEARGALPPERCVRPEDLFPELERRNCVFNTEVNVIR